MKKLMAICLCLILLVSLTISASAVSDRVLQGTQSVVRILVKYPNGMGSGSGFVIESNSRETLIATNYHVVSGEPSEISVWIGEEELVAAEILVGSEQKDLCILRVNVPTKFRKLTLADKEAKQGDVVYAVGFPAAADTLTVQQSHTGKDAAISDGIVSAVREIAFMEDGEIVRSLQITAPINPGNSGGPLLNEKGQVVGISTYTITDTQGIFGAVDVSELKLLLTVYGISVESPSYLWLWMAAGLILVFVLVILICRKRQAEQKAAFQFSWLRTGAGLAGFLMCAYMGSCFGAYLLARNDRFLAADKLLLAAPVTRIHSPKLVDYVRAGKQLEMCQYEKAKAGFENLSGYLNADILALETEYLRSLDLVKEKNFEAAIGVLEDLEEAGYGEYTGEIQQIQYLWAMDLRENRDFIGAYTMLAALKEHPDARTSLDALEKTIYREGITAYHKGENTQAGKLFACVSGYENAEKYITLIEVKKSQGSITKELYEKLIANFSFEDTAEVVLYNQAAAKWFLLGTWENGEYSFTMYPNGEIDCDLPWIEYGDYYRIEKGELLLYPENQPAQTKPAFRFQASTVDRMEIYCCRNRRTYTLYRQ